MPTPRRRVSSPNVAEPPPERWSNCIVVGDVCYVSGMTSRANDGKTILGANAYEQAQVIFGKIKHLVEAAGGGMGDVTKLVIYCTSIRDNTEVWRARREFFTGDFPVSTLVGVKELGTPDTLVEIEAIAHIGSGKA
ncbi:MAG: RidA family protein [Hyphomicrobiaceae bacterium]|nr:RidA family protein [Hyphomicrobiaceae bacterium]